jgi:4-hydroxy-tetrahydrodipicolinate reductase
MDTPHHITRLWIHGITGRMGQAITQILSESSHHHFQLLGGSSKNHLSEVLNLGKLVTPQTLSAVLSLDHPHIIADFTSVEGNAILLESLVESPHLKTKVLLGTTGLPPEQFAKWQSLGQTLPILFAPNTSLGIIQMLKAARTIAAVLCDQGFDLEIIETHHKHKKDSPSGTALFLAECLAKTTQKQVVKNPQGERSPGTLGVHGVRGGLVIGEHEIRFIGEDQEVTISHRAFQRSLFAKGALKLCEWLHHQQNPGFYQLEDINL